METDARFSHVILLLNIDSQHLLLGYANQSKPFSNQTNTLKLICSKYQTLEPFDSNKAKHSHLQGLRCHVKFVDGGWKCNHSRSANASHSSFSSKLVVHI